MVMINEDYVLIRSKTKHDKAHTAYVPRAVT